MSILFIAKRERVGKYLYNKSVDNGFDPESFLSELINPVEIVLTPIEIAKRELLSISPRIGELRKQTKEGQIIEFRRIQDPSDDQEFLISYGDSIKKLSLQNAASVLSQLSDVIATRY
jgi:hypothetical protein